HHRDVRGRGGRHHRRELATANLRSAQGAISPMRGGWQNRRASEANVPHFALAEPTAFCADRILGCSNSFTSARAGTTRETGFCLLGSTKTSAGREFLFRSAWGA